MFPHQRLRCRSCARMMHRMRLDLRVPRGFAHHMPSNPTRPPPRIRKNKCGPAVLCVESREWRQTNKPKYIYIFSIFSCVLWGHSRVLHSFAPVLRPGGRVPSNTDILSYFTHSSVLLLYTTNEISVCLENEGTYLSSQ